MPRISAAIAASTNASTTLPAARPAMMVENARPRPVSVSMLTMTPAAAQGIATTMVEPAPFARVSIKRCGVCRLDGLTKLMMIAAARPYRAARTGAKPQ